MKKPFDATKPNALKNAQDNLVRLRASLVAEQQQELEKNKAILLQSQKDYDNVQDELAKLDEDSDAYVEQLKRVEEIALVMSLTQETIAQYQMNLAEFGVDI